MIADPYGRWLAWLMEHAPEALAEPPGQRGTPERLMAWMRSLQHLAPMTRWRRLDGALQMMRAAAPEADWGAQLRLLAHLRAATMRNHGQRKQGRILSSEVLLQAGLDLAGSGAEAATTPMTRMAHRRDGLMVAFLALLPLRLTTFRTLELGQSVLRMDGRWVVAVEGDRMKAGRPWEAPLPQVLADPFARYVDEVRPWLMARQPYSGLRLRLRIGKVTRALTGVLVPPHFFRDAAATTAARASPDAARLIRPLLAHASYATAERHYVHAQGIEAGRDYAALLTRLKQESNA
jgi:integrase